MRAGGPYTALLGYTGGKSLPRGSLQRGSSGTILLTAAGTTSAGTSPARGQPVHLTGLGGPGQACPVLHRTETEARGTACHKQMPLDLHWRHRPEAPSRGPPPPNGFLTVLSYICTHARTHAVVHASHAHLLSPQGKQGPPCQKGREAQLAPQGWQHKDGNSRAPQPPETAFALVVTAGLQRRPRWPRPATEPTPTQGAPVRFGPLRVPPVMAAAKLALLDSGPFPESALSTPVTATLA